MAKKALIIIIVAAVLGLGLAGAGIFFIMKDKAPEEEPGEVVVEKFDLKNGKHLTLEKVQVALMKTTSKASYLMADFVITFKSEEALKQAETMTPYIKDAIMSVFEKKTSEELAGNREAMKEPVLNAIKALFNNEEDKEQVVSVAISSYNIQ